MLILVTGATGYVGGRLVPRLLEAGYRVRVLVRDPGRLQGRSWAGQVEVAQGDVLRPETLPAALAGVNVAYYLVHSMAIAGDFPQRDLVAARHFSTAAKEAGVERIIYLGGLGDPSTGLSKHLRSRQDTGAILREAGVPVTEFRAAVIIGSGSVSFEIIRYLTERLPIILSPRWVFTPAQPIAIRDVLAYLKAALEVPESAGRIVEIGGAGVLSYKEMILGYAHARKLRRILLPVPALSSSLSARVLHWLTPIPQSIALPLIEGLRNEVVVRDNTARRLFPDIVPMHYLTAVQLAFIRLETGRVETIWSTALATSQGDKAPVMLAEQEGLMLESRTMVVEASPRAVFQVFTGLGGDRGWFYGDWMWHWRGRLDRIIGGVGFRRRRRHPDEISVGEALDFWRVEAVDPDRLLRLRAEMRTPGRAWLQFEAQPLPNSKTSLTQTAFFFPTGLSGLLYWYLLYPVHKVIFSGLIQSIARRAESASKT
ncbi:MAG: SDR family oxidoreductase [Dehalococcoidia bacterium]|nr:SDR family oxidoreductase [Dehalococcoidia bacterium]